MQSKKMSFIESWANIFAGLGVSMLMVAYVFPWIGVEVTLIQNMQAATLFTVASLARSYTLRRLFNSIKERR